MKQESLVNKYDRRLKEMPKQNKQLIQQLRKYQDLVDSQNIQINQQNTKIKLFQTQMIKLDKLLEQRENQINQLTESQQKNTVKQKKYFLQIENYNKKIQGNKQEVAKVQKSVAILKKDCKNIQSVISTANSQSKKVLSTLTKGQIKINSLTQTLNDLKMKLMEQHTNKGKQNMQDQSKKDQKIIQQLFSAIKKQLALIDVLKRQKVHVIASTVFKYCEQQFQKVLEMNQQK